jgi:hypothetical protein
MPRTKIIGVCLLSWVLLIGGAPALPTAETLPLPEGIPPIPDAEPALCIGRFLTPEQGAAMLQRRLKLTANLEEWKTYSTLVKKQMLIGAELDPLPRRTPLNPIVRNKRAFDGYTVESIALEIVPGYWASCTLYRPANTAGPYPVVLCPNGHGGGRLADYVQTRCAMLARMGCISMSLNLFGWGETPDQAVKRQHTRPFALTAQTWTNMRALDFLLSLEGADPTRVGVTGFSGGGTQSFILTALDDRVTVSVPVTMVSSHMFGGCSCESHKPIHRSENHFTNNAEIAALAAPRPMLIVSDGKDWTASTPEVEFPFIKTVYGYYDAGNNVTNLHLANEGHDYGPTKRRAMYEFLANQFSLDLGKIQNADGKIDESLVTTEKETDMYTFDASFPIPEGALTTWEDVEVSLQKLQ